MAFNYEHIRKKRETENNVWTAYSDLFTSMAFLFLMLYVSVSLRSTTQGMISRSQIAQAKQEAQEMREQLRAYDSIKSDYLQKSASTQEQATYKRLMEKLSLLQDQATQEKQALETKAKENAEKAAALNEYQRAIRNIINANMVARGDIKQRETIIEAKNTQIQDAAQKLLQANDELTKAQETTALKAQEVEGLTRKMQAAEQGYREQIAELKQEHEKAQETERQKFLGSLEREKLSADSRVKREREYRKQMEKSNQAYGQKVAELNKNLATTSHELDALAGQRSQLAAEVAAKNSELSRKANETRLLEGDLKRANAVANYKRELAQHIRNALAQAGVKAEVDEKSGDVTLAFGNEYFETNEATLKPGMKQILEKFVPVYAKSLFDDAKISREIKSVDLVGFASPTYKRHYVDPGSLASSDRKAVNYNMDLSYQRAKSIFNYIFNTKLVRYENQDRLLPLVKVTGRSYLASKKSVGGREPASLDAKQFCKVYNCMESQKVIIKFNLEE